MQEPNFSALVATLGPVLGPLVGLYLLAKYTGFGRVSAPEPKDASRGEVLAEIKALRKENQEESRAIRHEIAGVKDQVTDLRARSQENIADHGRRLDRLERK